jgi:hypothetical protein
MSSKPISRRDSDELSQKLREAFWSNDPIRNADKERRRLESEESVDNTIAEGWDSLGWDEYE